jgi:Ca2+-transporting ATPase
MSHKQTNWHLLTPDETALELKCSSKGLTNHEAKKRLLEHGQNQLKDKKKRSAIQMFIYQFKDLMILILVAAAIVSGLIGDTTDTFIILAIILINALVGFIQEYNAAKAMEALKVMASSNSQVIRDGKTTVISSLDIVIGDLVKLEAGNIIPADVRFIETHAFKVDESTLTGESGNADKNSHKLKSGEYTLGDRTNMGYKGTIVTNGRAHAYVVATGMHTELGHIAKLIQTDDKTTPLQKRLTEFGKKLTFVILGICVVVFMIGYLRGEDILQMLLFSISLAVAAIPEALPALVTIALALGAKRLVKNNALIRKLSAVETLGSVTYVCTDKTGTLTLNKMTVQEIFEIEGNNLPGFSDFKPLLVSMALNHDVSKGDKNKLIGDSTEVAMVEFAAQHKLEKNKLEKEFPRVAELPFDSVRKCMTTLHQTKEGILVITKGAVDELSRMLTDSEKKRIKEFESTSDSIAKKGYRVIGFAARMLKALPEKDKIKSVEEDLTMIGFVGMIDPPKPEAKQAVLDCKMAGIIPVMITGDHKITAEAIANQLGIISTGDELILDGIELGKLHDKEFTKIVEKVRVYARVNPEQKLRIISALQKRGHFIAMTGDGVNDAPALKNADIGIAMGKNGTEVAKEASHLILLDDNFATILKAVKQGRRIFDNILKFIKYILTGNLGEIWAILLAQIFSLPLPLLAIQILWINLVTDGLPGLALASEPSEPNIMKRPPRNPAKSVFADGMAWHILWVGFLMGAVTLGMQMWSMANCNDHWQTMTFTVLCFSQMGHVMAIRSQSVSLFKMNLFSNKKILGALLLTLVLQLSIIYTPFGNSILSTQALTFKELMLTLLVSIIVFVAVEIEKIVIARLKKRKNRD